MLRLDWRRRRWCACWPAEQRALRLRHRRRQAGAADACAVAAGGACASSACAMRRRAPMMAAAVHAGSGRMAVALGEMGPGGLNLASGMGVAFNNNLPLLAITTNQHRAAAYPHSGMFMDLDTRAVFAPLTKWNAVVHDPRRMPELARRAFREALSGRPGPGAPGHSAGRAVGRRATSPTTSSTCRPSRYRADHRARARRPSRWTPRVRCCATRKRPLVVAGGGVVTSGAADAVREHRRRSRRAGGADADGARRGRQRQPALHRPRRPDRGRRGARGLRAAPT